jgi:hypothetical protein
VATFTVDQSTTLTDFLGSAASFQAWRVPLLVQHGAVTVTRAGARVTPIVASTQVRHGDLVVIADPLPGRYLAALAALPTSAFWDYAFVPGTDAASGYARQFFTAKPQSKVIVGYGLPDDTLESFITALGRSPNVDHPIAYPVVVSHANEEGQLFIAMNLLTGRVIEYEDLENAVASHRLVVDPALLQPRPTVGGSAAVAQLRVRGCRIGNAPPFLRKLKEALGGTMQVNAPKHFQEYGTITSTGRGTIGSYESMSYDFSVSRPTPLANSRALVQAFQRSGFTRIDQSAVPPATWTTLMGLRGMPNIHSSGHHSLAYQVVAPIPGNRVPLSGMAEFRYEREELFSGWSAFPLASDPGTNGRRRSAVQTELSTQPLYRPSHPYPMWIRMGFPSLAAFMDGWFWTYQYDRSHHQLRYRAVRSRYTFVVAITRPGTNELVMNFYGAGGRPTLEQLRADDPAYYATV